MIKVGNLQRKKLEGSKNKVTEDTNSKMVYKRWDNEFDRLLSFDKDDLKFCDNVIELASHGFYCLSRKFRTIKCYLCGVEFSLKNFSNIEEVHKKSNPTCLVVTSRDLPNNFKLNITDKHKSEYYGLVLDEALVNLFRSEEQLNSKKNNQYDNLLNEIQIVKKCHPTLKPLDDKESKLTKDDVEKLYYFPTILEISAPIERSKFENQDAKAKRLLYFRNEYSSEGAVTKRIKDTINFTASDFDPLYPMKMNHSNPGDIVNMRKEANRLKSFEDPNFPWSGKKNYSAKALAKEGFFCLFELDRVQCAFCKGVLRDWKELDDVREEHRKYFPTCPRLIGFEVGNEPLDHDSRDQMLKYSIMASNNNSSNDSDPVVSISDELCLAHEFKTVAVKPVFLVNDPSLIAPKRKYRAFFANMRHYKQRKSSFERHGWPQVLTSVEDMAAAGFFRRSHQPIPVVTCFCCALVVTRWTSTDNPFFEHARLSPRCMFVLQNLGMEFVLKVTALFTTPYAALDKSLDLPPKMLDVGTTIDDNNFDTTQSPFHLNDRLSIMDFGKMTAVEFRSEQRETKARLDLLPVRLLSPPFSVQLVRHLLEVRLQKTGDDFSDWQHLLWELFAATEKRHEFGLSEEDYVMQREQLRNQQNMENDEQDKGSVNVDELEDWQLCKICMDKLVNITFLPCGHFCSCRGCAPALRHCPICRSNIRGTVQMRLVSKSEDQTAALSSQKKEMETKG